MNLEKPMEIETMKKQVEAIYESIPAPKRILKDVKFRDLGEDKDYVLDYMIFTSCGPLFITFSEEDFLSIAIKEAALREFMFANTNIKYIPGFCYGSDESSIKFFSTPNELAYSIVNRVFKGMPPIHEQELYEQYSIAQQYTVDKFDETMEARNNKPDVDSDEEVSEENVSGITQFANRNRFNDFDDE